MGKKEKELMSIRLLVLMMALLTIPFGLYLFLWSMPASQLESNYIQEAEYKVDKVNKVPLSGGGLALVSDNSSENALMQIYAKVPLLNRYMYTESYNFREEGGPINYVVRVWACKASLTWDKGVVTPTGKSDDDGWGVGGKVLFYLVAFEIYMAAMMLIRNDIIKTRREKAANPPKNY